MSFVLLNFHNMIKNQFGVTIKRFWSDNARDYFNQVLTPYFQHEGIIHKSSCVNTSQHNGIAKRKNGRLLDTTQAFLLEKHVSKSYQGEAILTTIDLINRLLSKVLGFKSLMDILSLFYPNMRTINYLIPNKFGCVFFVHVHSLNKGKLDPRAIKYIFMGYSSLKKGISVTIHHPIFFFVSTDFTFNESESYFPTPYLQGENSIKEDKGQDSYLIDPFLIDPPKVSSLVFDSVSIPQFSKPKPSSLELAPKNQMTSKVYSRKKVAVPKLIQV